MLDLAAPLVLTKRQVEAPGHRQSRGRGVGQNPRDTVIPKPGWTAERENVARLEVENVDRIAPLHAAEEEARRMLAEDPALKAEFERRLRDDPEFAKSPGARLDFFYRRHPAWDPGTNRYPVLRTDTALK